MATAVHYDPNMNVGTARAQYFNDNSFGEDGGYSAKWVTLFKLGPLALGFPNTPARVRAVRLHDLHHLATGYDTDIVGEAEIAAWELGSDCSRFPAATVLNTLALALGVLREPERMRRAYARGCNSLNLYTAEYSDELLRQRLGDLRERLCVDAALEAPFTPEQRKRYAKQVAVSLLAGTLVILLAAGMLAGLVALLWWLLA
jgi:hypothetical protein